MFGNCDGFRVSPNRIYSDFLEINSNGQAKTRAGCAFKKKVNVKESKLVLEDA